MITFTACRNEREFEICVDFILRHRRDFYPAYNLVQVLTFFSVSLFQGEIIAAWNENQELVGLAAYIYGTPKEKFTNKRRVRMEIVCIAEEYRKTGLFFQGMKHVIAYLSQVEVDVKEIEFYSPDNNTYLKRLFSKFTTLKSTTQTKLGMENYFYVTMDDLSKFCSR
jgi:hypothetical protein